jgi:hypothetical protein
LHGILSSAIGNTAYRAERNITMRAISAHELKTKDRSILKTGYGRQSIGTWIIPIGSRL